MKNLKKKINDEYLNSEISKIKEEDLDIALKNNKKISEKISNAGALKKYAELAKAMFGMIRDYQKGAYRKVPWFTIAAAAFSLLYIFNPLDIVPDFIPGLGYIDDFVVFTSALKFIQSDIHEYLDWKVEEAKLKKA